VRGEKQNEFPTVHWDAGAEKESIRSGRKTGMKERAGTADQGTRERLDNEGGKGLSGGSETKRGKLDGDNIHDQPKQKPTNLPGKDHY